MSNKARRGVQFPIVLSLTAMLAGGAVPRRGLAGDGRDHHQSQGEDCDGDCDGNQFHRQGSAPKVVLISLDGAKPDLIEKYLNTGVLLPDEGLGELRRRGVVA